MLLAYLVAAEDVKVIQPVDCYERHGMLILLPSDVQGRGNALIISSRVPLKEDQWWGGLQADWVGCSNPA